MPDNRSPFETELPQRRAPFRMATALRTRLQDGGYAPDTWLPTEGELLFDYRVSRTVLREALIILECLGLIEAHPGVGWKVTRRSQALENQFAATVDAIDLLEAGRLFESEAVTLTVAEGAEDLPTALAAGSVSLEGCRTFHVQLAQACRNAAVAMSIAHIWQVGLQRPQVRAVLAAGLTSLGDQVHALQTAIVAAVRSRDGDSARRAVKALFDAYLAGALDFEESERLQRANVENEDMRRLWARRLRPASRRTRRR